MKILLIEDDPETMTHIVHLLRNAGHEVEHSSDGERRARPCSLCQFFGFNRGSDAAGDGWAFAGPHVAP